MSMHCPLSMAVSRLVSLLLCVLCLATETVVGYPRNKDYPLSELTVEDSISSVKEPTCDELRNMWRFSKRQSRAAQITNSIPGYKDPFAYNEWEGGTAKLRLASGRPVYYGKMLYAPGPQAMNFRNAEKTKAFSEYFGTPQYFPNTNSKAPKNLFRLGVGGSKDRTGLMVPSTGSFLHLKDLIKKERARELHDQHTREEGRVRAVSLKNMVVNNYGLAPDNSDSDSDSIPDSNSFFSKSNRNRHDDDDPQQKAFGQVVKSAQPSSFVNSRSVPSYSSEW